MKLTADEKRQMVADKYRTIIGKNRLCVNRRKYCYTPYEDGRCYSDAASSVALTYKEVGFPFPYNAIPDVVGIYQNKALTPVPVVIEDGIIQNPEVLRVGDMLLFAGKDVNRWKFDYVDHVEMVYKIDENGVTLCGQGGKNPSLKEMNGYCRTRHKLKAKTKRGNKGLIMVKRFIQDDKPKKGDSNGN